MNRRDFLKLTGAAVGGIVMGSCGGNGGGAGGGAGGDAPMPIGYRFFRIAGPGAPLPDGTRVAKVGEGSMMNRSADVIMFADNSSGRGGMYQFAMDYSGARPAIGAGRKVVAQGDAIDGFEVGHIGYGSSNRAGHNVCVLKMTSGLNGVYADRDGAGMRPVVLPTGAKGGTDDPNLTFHGYWGDVDMDDAGNILAKAVVHTQAQPLCREALVHVAAATGNKTVVAEEGAELPGGDEKIGAFGLLDLAGSNGHYAVQVFGSGQGAGLQGNSGGAAGSSGMLRGNVSEHFLRAKTLAASASASLKKSQRTAVLTGNVQYGPRIGADARVAQVIHRAADFPVLTFDGREVISKGMLTPLGNVVTSMGAPIVAESGLVYVVLESENRTAELCIYNGSILRTVLASGDPVVSSGGDVPIRAFAFGVLRDMMDDTGRLVMTGAFDDGLHVVVGIPY